MVASLISYSIERLSSHRNVADGELQPPTPIAGTQIWKKLKNNLANTYDSSHLRALRPLTAEQLSNFCEIYEDDDQSQYLLNWWTVSRIGLQRKQADKHRMR